jgi:hypothetical protein
MMKMISAKNASLVALALQQVSLVLIIRHSRIRQAEDESASYIISTAGVSAENIKLILNLSLELTVRQVSR